MHTRVRGAGGGEIEEGVEGLVPHAVRARKAVREAMEGRKMLVTAMFYPGIGESERISCHRGGMTEKSGD